jgi:hypothetical protein
MTQNPIKERRYVFFRSARVILDENLFLKLLQKKEHSFIVAILQNNITVPDFVIRKQKRTANISLRRAPAEILQSFHDTTRNEVRRTFTMEGLTITQDDARFTEAYALYKTFRLAKGLPVKPPSFLRQAMRMSAYWQDTLIAVVTWYDVTPYMRIQHIFSRDAKTPEERKISGYATRRLIYEICVYGSNAGREYLDLASVNMYNIAKQGITNFKLSFGASLADEYIYTYKSPFLRWVGTVVPRKRDIKKE